MDLKQRAALQACLPDLITDLDIQMQYYLCGKTVLTETHMDLIKAEAIQKGQRLKLLNILKSRADGWNHLLDALKQSNQVYLIDKLQSALLAFEHNKQLYSVDSTAFEESYQTLETLAISKLWNVPQSNPYFAGRVSLFEQLNTSFAAPSTKSQLEQDSTSKSQKRLSESSVTVILACDGIEGVGKTQLAIEFVHRHKDVYPYVFWFPAENTSQIDIAYQKLAINLKMDMQQPADAIVRDIKAWFERHPGCLLIYDNAPNPEGIHSYLPLTGSHILVTSRTTEWHWLKNSFSIAVDVFTIDEAREYFQKILGDRLEMDEVDKLSELLGYLPLALAQAAAYMKKMKVNLSRYLELYEKHKEKLLADDSLPKFITSRR